MQGQDELTPADRELESALGGLRPAGAGIDRGELMFRLGRASARRRSVWWQGLAGALAAALVASLIARPAPREVERIVHVPIVQPAEPGQTHSPVLVATASAMPEDAYLNVRRRVLEMGLDALPAVANGLHEPAAALRPAVREAQIITWRDLLPFGTQGEIR
ncbi:MAG TPA: hypothetical protein VNA25_08750 [Phycisphaerae bacterium]|nr:hypothetical protein [Phycisphaerae bacterium]